MAPATLVVLWRVTERCDLACAFCAFDRTLSRSRRVVDARPALAFGAVLGAYARETGTRVLLSWLGGEPLTWAPLAAVSQTLHQEHGLALSLTTNGTRLDQAWVQDLLLSHFAEVTVSVDGLGSAHDLTRGRAGLFEQLARAVRALATARRARGSGPLLRANVVLMRGNAGAFGELCHVLAQWGIGEITFNQLGGNDRPEFFADNRLLPHQVEQLAAELPVLRAVLARQGVVLRGDAGYLTRIKASSAGQTLSPQDCAPGRQFLFIDEAGRVAPCSFTPQDYGVALEDITTPADITRLPARFAALRRAHAARACADCHSTQHHGKFAVATP